MSDPVEATDDQLVARVRLGDQEAVAQLRRRHHRAGRRVAVSLLGEDGPVDEVVSEAFARVLGRVLSGPGDLVFRPSLLLAVRRAADTRRSAGSVEDLGACPAGGVDGLPVGRPCPVTPPAPPEVPRSPLPAGVPTPAVRRRPRVEGAAPRWARRAAVRRHLEDEHDEACRRVAGRLDAWVAGELGAAEDEAVAEHLTGCARCQALEVDLAECRPGRQLAVPVLLVLLVVGALLVPGRLGAPTTPAEAPVASAEMAVPSSVPSTVLGGPTTTAPTPPPPPPTAAPGSPGAPSTSATSAPPDTRAPSTTLPAGAPAPREAPGQGGEEPVPGSDEPASPPTTAPAFLDTEQDLLVAEGQGPQPGTTVVDGAPTTRLSLDAGPLTVSLSSGLSREASSPLRLTVANPAGVAGEVRVRLSPEAGVALWAEPADEATCPSVGTDVVCRWPSLGASATVNAHGPMLPGRTAPVTVAVVVELDGRVVGRGDLVLPVS